MDSSWAWFTPKIPPSHPVLFASPVLIVTHSHVSDTLAASQVKGRTAEGADWLRLQPESVHGTGIAQIGYLSLSGA